MPAVILFTVFYLAPIFISVYYSFTDFSGIGAAKFIGFKNYQVLLNDKFFFILLKAPLNAVYNTVGFQAQLSFVGSAVFPWLVLAVGIRPGGPAPLAFDAKEHSADKGVNGGFACFILAVDNIDAVLKGDRRVMKFTKSAYV